MAGPNRVIRTLLVVEGPSDIDAVQHVLTAWLGRQHQDQTGGDKPGVILLEDQNGSKNKALYFKKIPPLYHEHLGRRTSYRGGVGKGDVRIVRQLIQILPRMGWSGHCILWIRDEDGQGRATDARNERDEMGYSPLNTGTIQACGPIIMGYAQPCVEAWAILGAYRSDAKTVAAIKTLKQDLSLDPVQSAHRLSHKENSPRSAKEVLRRLLLAADEDRGQYLQRAVRTALSNEGTDQVGLRTFLNELDTAMSPLLSTP